MGGWGVGCRNPSPREAGAREEVAGVRVGWRVTVLRWDRPPAGPAGPSVSASWIPMKRLLGHLGHLPQGLSLKGGC